MNPTTTVQQEDAATRIESDNDGLDTTNSTEKWNKWASIEIVKNLQPIDGADNILRATVLGWQTVVKKSEFQEGDLCVWHNPDTIVDKSVPVYSILEKKKYKLSISKIRGVISQGLALPIKHFEEKLQGIKLEPGTDVTKEVGIKHYEKPTTAYVGEDIGTPWPGFLRKTDQPNLRSVPAALDELKEAGECVITQKMDGTSATYFYHNNKWGACSRNFQIVPAPDRKPSVYYQVVYKYKLKERMEKLGKTLAVQGEVCGPNIGCNRVGLKEITFFVFHVWDINNLNMISFDEMVDLVNQLNDMDPTAPKLTFAPYDLLLPLSRSDALDDHTCSVVPIVRRGPITETLEELMQLSNKQTYGQGKLAEGIVIQPVKDVYSPSLVTRLSVKVISEVYELKYDR